MTAPVALVRSGLVTSVGLTAAASCAAIRAKVSNPSETRYIDSGGEWIMGHSVPLKGAWRGGTKLVKMAVIAIRDCLQETAHQDWSSIPLLLCIADRDRPGRLADLDHDLFARVQRELGVEFSKLSLIIPQSRVGVGTALLQARRLIVSGAAPRVLIAATDSLLGWQSLSAFERAGRVLTTRNSNGFMPGEAAAALLVAPSSRGRELLLCGLGFANEPSNIDAEQPVRGEGLALAIKHALHDANCNLHELDFRIADLGGEQYYFKEAALALARVLRKRKERFEIWHPSECIGETGATAGVAALVVAHVACSKGYAPGPGILCHLANDSGERTAIVLRHHVSS